VMGKHFDEATMLRVAQAVEAGQMSGSMRQDAKVVGEAQQVP
jgi:hypothetical protein